MIRRKRRRKPSPSHQLLAERRRYDGDRISIQRRRYYNHLRRLLMATFMRGDSDTVAFNRITSELRRLCREDIKEQP